MFLHEIYNLILLSLVVVGYFESWDALLSTDQKKGCLANLKMGSKVIPSKYYNM